MAATWGEVGADTDASRGAVDIRNVVLQHESGMDNPAPQEYDRNRFRNARVQCSVLFALLRDFAFHLHIFVVSTINA